MSGKFTYATQPAGRRHRAPLALLGEIWEKIFSQSPRDTT